MPKTPTYFTSRGYEIREGRPMTAEGSDPQQSRISWDPEAAGGRSLGSEGAGRRTTRELSSRTTQTPTTELDTQLSTRARIARLAVGSTSNAFAQLPASLGRGEPALPAERLRRLHHAGGRSQDLSMFRGKVMRHPFPVVSGTHCAARHATLYTRHHAR